MNSSGIKRGLASLAVSALAVSGLTALSGAAHAAPLTTPGDSIALVSQDGVGASVANDGKNTTISLVAVAGADIKQVRYAYSVAGGADQVIATVSRENGAFSTQWAAPTNVLGATVTLKAIGLDASGAVLGQSTESVLVTGSATAVAIATAAGAEVGAYDVPGGSTVAAVTGTTTSASLPNLDSVVVAAGNGPRAFSGVLDLGNYAWDNGTPATGTTPAVPAVNEALLVASTGQSDDVVPVKLYKQQIKGVTATAKAAQVPTGTTTAVTVKVVDQKGAPVAGALVSDANGNNETTNGLGEATFTGVGVGNHRFHANTTADGAYDDTVDYASTVAISGYNQALTAVELKTAQQAYDLDETIAVDVKAKDQHGADMPATTLRAQWTHTGFATGGGFGGGAGQTPAPTVLAVQTVTGGTVPAPAGGFKAGDWSVTVWAEKDGTPGPGQNDTPASTVAFKAGNAKIAWDASNAIAQAALGTAVTLNGKIVLEGSESTVLAGREASVTLSSDITGSAAAKLVAKADQPATVVSVAADGSSAQVKTGADGSFSVKVSDPAATAAGVTPEIKTQRENVALVASSAITPNSTLDLDFQDIEIRDIALSFGAGEATPGRAVIVTGTVRNKADNGDVLANTPVDLSLDKGFFVVAGGPVAVQIGQSAGALTGENFIDLGKTRSVVTDKNGRFSMGISIARDADFDDDFLADIKLTATAGAVSKSATKEFTSVNPLNLRSVEILHSEDQGVEGSDVLPKASVDRTVHFEVKALDQFGNRTHALVELDATGPSADAIDGDTFGATPAGQPTFTVPGSRAGDLKVSGIVDPANKSVWKDRTPAPAPSRTWTADTTSGKVTAAPLTTTWYEIDFAKSDYSLTHNGDELNPVGKVVRATFAAVDQEGDSIRNMAVEFFRSGPGEQIIIDPFQGANVRWTNDEGVATVTFQGTREGTAVVSTVGNDRRDNVVDEAELSTEIVFGSEATPEPEPEPTPEPTPTPEPQPNPAPKAITVKLKGKNNGKKADRLNAVASTDAKGATIRLQRRNAKGKWVTVRTATLNASGNATFRVKDRNGKKATAYRVRVLKTAATKAAVSSVKRVR